MITFECVTKRFAGGTVAVDELDLTVRDGEVVVLVGPSGCGKTTTMRMVNRMVEPTSGRVTVGGDDVAGMPAHELRRRVGYVIQHSGLFPHRTIAENIATVPQLIGWDRQRISARVEEMIHTVGLEGHLADRYPHQLSGGQRQRVGVARALAADPPIMLMDEPFGAVDPLVRGRLQEEFLRLQAQVRKTIVFVTHDIDEAVTMGDRIAILAQGGVLQQFDTPEEVLSDPANDFVADFLGAERGLKRLGLIPVSEVKAEPGPVVHPGDGRERAEEVARGQGTDWVVVVDEHGRLHGWAWVADIGQQVADAEVHEFGITIRATDSLRTALDVMVSSRGGVAVRVKSLDGGVLRYEGLLTHDVLHAELA